MSLILEALKKSEANRRLGQAPDLGTPFTPARRERSPLWALIAIVLSLGFGLWWWFGRGTPVSAPAKPPVATTAAPTPARSAASAQNPESPQQEDKRNFAAARREDSNERSSAAAGKDEQVWVAAQRHDATELTAKRPARMAPPAVAQIPPVTHTPPAPAPVAAPAQPARAPKTADTRGYTPPPQAHPEIAPQPASAAPRLDMPTYYDLPFATRKSLPQLSMSMHVYTADSKQRFVILDGTRMAEGDTTSDSLTLREIRPDGVVLEFQGQRFFFPRDGL